MTGPLERSPPLGPHSIADTSVVEPGSCRTTIIWQTSGILVDVFELQIFGGISKSNGVRILEFLRQMIPLLDILLVSRCPNTNADRVQYILATLVTMVSQFWFPIRGVTLFRYLLV